MSAEGVGVVKEGVYQGALSARKPQTPLCDIVVGNEPYHSALREHEVHVGALAWSAATAGHDCALLCGFSEHLGLAGSEICLAMAPEDFGYRGSLALLDGFIKVDKAAPGRRSAKARPSVVLPEAMKPMRNKGRRRDITSCSKDRGFLQEA